MPAPKGLIQYTGLRDLGPHTPEEASAQTETRVAQHSLTQNTDFLLWQMVPFSSSTLNSSAFKAGTNLPHLP